MPVASATYDAVRVIAQKMVELLGEPTPAAIREKVNLALTVADLRREIDPEALARDLESRFSMVIGEATILDDDGTGHVPWLPGRRAEITWHFWNRYREYLETAEGLPPAVVARIDQLTDDVLERIEDPTRAGTWVRRGLVAGQVQSGKTANYTTLICKAVDAGYKLIVVMAGMHNSLRSQTQLRIDEGVLGIDTSRTPAFQQNDDQTFRIGVGVPPYPWLRANSLTTSADKGDFRRRVAENAGIIPGGDPLVLVVKKHSSVLKNLHDWAKAVAGQPDPATKRVVVRNVPLLLIDDEADIASINTKEVPVNADGTIPDDYDVTKINGAIRRFLHLFEQKVYVAYTATPFANVFIHPEHETKSLGQDLFPRNFIVNLPAPSNYVGSAQVFGLSANPDSGFTGSPGLDIIRYAEDQDEWMPPGHETLHTPTHIPRSVREALRAFLLACAARTARGQGARHKSMLIHVTRYTHVQGVVADLVARELTSLRQRLEFGDGAAPDDLRKELRGLWEEDFVSTTGSVGELAGPPVTWEEVDAHLFREAAKIQVRKINGTAKDVLDYKENAKIGLNIIAIGGDKLSRGLTLEGLTVSYYLRAAKMYDTLMQMGRWFGYRPGYVDLCRIYTTTELAEWYRHITLASEELREQFDVMAAAGATPEEFGFKVRTHPDGLMITAANKLRNGRVMKLSYSGDVSETILFDKDRAILHSNLRAVERLVEHMGGQSATAPADSGRVPYCWTQVAGERVAEFLEGFRTHRLALKTRAELLAQYVRKQIDRGELTDWTVAVLSIAGAKRVVPVADLNVGLTTRAPFPAKRPLPTGVPIGSPDGYLRFPDRYSIATLRSPRDEMIDLSATQYAEAMRLTKEIRANKANERTRKAGEKVRKAEEAAARPARSSGNGAHAGATSSSTDVVQRATARSDPDEAKEPTLPSGPAIRIVREKTRGLLLIHLLDHLHADPAEPPPIGLVISFPESDTAEAIDYTVNNVYWQQEFGG